MTALATTPAAELSAAQDRPTLRFGGLQQSAAMARWLWDHVAAVAADVPGLECWPSTAADDGDDDGPWMLHEVLLSGWGCPIGELFDLERLADACRAARRWSFFVASEPCNVPGGVAR